MQINRHKKAAELFNNIDSHPEKYLIIHYSCESFKDLPEGRSAMITSIAVESLESAQCTSFAIYKEAEKSKIPFSEISNHYQNLERSMLKEFYSFINENKTCHWIHWNMRNIQFGFQAIEHRYAIHGEHPIVIADDHKHNLAQLLEYMYGPKYISDPKMETLAIKNHLIPKDFLNGKEEADAFENKKFVELHQSTMAKTRLFSRIIRAVNDNALKVDTGIKDAYGLNPQSLYMIFQDVWWVKLGVWIITMIIAGFVGHWVTLI